MQTHVRDFVISCMDFDLWLCQEHRTPRMSRLLPAAGSLGLLHAAADIGNAIRMSICILHQVPRILPLPRQQHQCLCGQTRLIKSQARWTHHHMDLAHYVFPLRLALLSTVLPNAGPASSSLGTELIRGSSLAGADMSQKGYPGLSRGSSSVSLCFLYGIGKYRVMSAQAGIA